MRPYRLKRNRIIVLLGFDFHMTSTSEGSVRKYSYVYQANFKVSNALVGITLKLAQSYDIYVVRK